MNEADAYAQSQGFPNAAAMRAYMQHRSESLHRQNTVGVDQATGAPSPTQAPAPPPKRSSSGIGVLFDYIARAMGGM